LRSEPATRRFDWSFAPIPTFEERFARQYLYEPPPEFPLASPYAGIVHRLSGPNERALTRIFRSDPPGSPPSGEAPDRSTVPPPPRGAEGFPPRRGRFLAFAFAARSNAAPFEARRCFGLPPRRSRAR